MSEARSTAESKSTSPTFPGLYVRAHRMLEQDAVHLDVRAGRGILSDQYGREAGRGAGAFGIDSARPLPGGGKIPATARAPAVTVDSMKVIRHTHTAAARATSSSAADA